MMEENKEEIQWITKIRRHFNLRIEIYKRKKTMQKGNPPDNFAAGKGDLSMLFKSEGK